MFYKSMLLGALLSVLAGCASVPMGDAAQDARLKTFVAKPDVAGLYIYRNETMGAAIRMDVTVDDHPLGQTAARTYFYTEIQPGRHTVTSKSENTDSMEFKAVAGKLYYVWQEVKMGVLFARTKLHLVADTEGQRGVSESRLAASAQGPAAPSPSSNGMSRTESVSMAYAAMANSSEKPAERNVYSIDPTTDMASSSHSSTVNAKRIGASSFTVEKLAKAQNCALVPAYLVSRDSPHEEYEVHCKDERVLHAACDFHQCQLMQ